MKSLNREEKFESTSREYLESKQCFLEKGAIMQLVLELMLPLEVL